MRFCAKIRPKSAFVRALWYAMTMTDAPQTLVVDHLTEPTRLDLWLTRHADLSRTHVQKIIKEGRITLNGKVPKTHHPVKNGDIVVITAESEHFSDQEKAVPPLEPAILYEDDNYLVVSKPTGLIVHGGPNIDEPTLSDWAVAHDGKIALVGDNPDERPGIVHRLDRDVSGAMVIAKTAKAFDDLKRQFQEHSIFKEYLALAHGRITDQTGRITFAIARKEDKSGLMVARPGSTEGKEAETKFTVVKYVKNMTLVRVQTLTGRMHQIRVHFKAIGHPLVGDPLYRMKRMRDPKNVPPRLFLHARLLAFDALDGSRKSLEAPLPSDLAQYLARVS